MNETARYALIDTENTLDRVTEKLVALQSLFSEPTNQYHGVAHILEDTVKELLNTPVMLGDFTYDFEKNDMGA